MVQLALPTDLTSGPASPSHVSVVVNCQQPTRPLRIRNACNNVDFLMHPYLGGPCWQHFLGELLTFVQDTDEAVLRIGVEDRTGRRFRGKSSPETQPTARPVMGAADAPIQVWGQNTPMPRMHVSKRVFCAFCTENDQVTETGPGQT